MSVLTDITKARLAVKQARLEILARQRIELAEELTYLNNDLDVKIRKAYNAGHKIVEIQNAYPTTAYKTIAESLTRTVDLVFEPVEPVSTSGSFTLDTGTTPMHIGVTAQDVEATFQVHYMNDGALMLSALTPLYDESGKMNEVVAELDGQFMGELHDEIQEWIKNESEDN